MQYQPRCKLNNHHNPVAIYKGLIYDIYIYVSDVWLFFSLKKLWHDRKVCRALYTATPFKRTGSRVWFAGRAGNTLR